MKKIMLLDTSIGSSNMGDHIIMECVKKELSYILDDNFVYNIPTHLCAFNGYSVWRNSLAIQTYTNCDYKFAGGSNLLVKNLKTHYPQWNIHKFDSRPLEGIVLVGVGAGAGERTNNYTTKLYQKVLNHDFMHSVRDERSKAYVESIGLKAVNTGCATMWMFTPEFCEQIPHKKASRVIFTITGRRNDQSLVNEYQDMIDILVRNYKQVFFWIQGDTDLDFFKRYKNTEDITVIPPNISDYEEILNQDDLDYVGTRLHGGIYAMRHKKRAVIVSIDERAREINRANHLNCIEKYEISEKLEAYINSEITTDIDMPFAEIKKWKDQFVL